MFTQEDVASRALGDIWGCVEDVFDHLCLMGPTAVAPFQTLGEESQSSNGWGVVLRLLTEERRVPMWPVGSGLKSKVDSLHILRKALTSVPVSEVCRPLKALILCV